jgi:hypothetical protein
MMLEIRVGNLEISGAPRDSGRGLIVKPDGFQGWRGLPAGRREALARAVEHGEHDVPTFLPARVVTIDGWILADSEEELEYLAESAAGVGATGARLPVVVSLSGSTRWADGRRVSCEVDDSVGGSLQTGFQLQLVFADPRKYGEVNVQPETGLATSITVFSRGNFPAYPVVEIPSAPAAYSISSPGGTFTISGATAGGTHSVDLRRGRVYRDGIEMLGVGHGNLWAVPAGESWVHTLSAPGRTQTPDTYV